MSSEKGLIDHLKNDPVKNCSFINFFSNYKPLYLRHLGKSCYAQGISDNPWIYISTDNEKDLNAILNLTEADDTFFAVIENWMISYFEQRWEIKWRLETLKYILPETVIVPETQTNLIPLTEENTEFIYNNSDYKEYTSKEYISERIRNGISAGLIKENKLAGWAITHDDNAIGFLYVLPEYRRNGLAEKILQHIIKKVREKGILPFAYIEEKNSPSIHLVEKHGFKNCGKISWVEILR